MTATATAPKRPLKRLRMLIVGLLGVLIGAAAFTFHFAEGSSYLSDDPQACVNCHIMQPQFDSWQKSSHHAVAKCVDCHLPAAFARKYYAKALNGWNHSKAFTLQDFPEPIQITETNARILQENCVRCHDELTHEVAGGASGDREDIRCTHCHRGAGHGETVGLGGPLRDDEIHEEK